MLFAYINVVFLERRNSRKDKIKLVNQQTKMTSDKNQQVTLDNDKTFMRLQDVGRNGDCFYQASVLGMQDAKFGSDNVMVGMMDWREFKRSILDAAKTRLPRDSRRVMLDTWRAEEEDAEEQSGKKFSELPVNYAPARKIWRNRWH